MDQARVLLSRYLRAAWRRRWLAVIIAWLACGLGWAAVYSMPNQYESTARMYVDAGAVLTPLLHGLAAECLHATLVQIKRQAQQPMLATS